MNGKQTGRRFPRALIAVITICFGVLLCMLAFYLLDTVFNGLVVETLTVLSTAAIRYLVKDKVQALSFVFSVFALIVLLIVGIIWFFSHRQTKRQLDTVLKSIDSVFRKDDSLIELPPSFFDVQNKLNSIKYENIRNEQLARESEQRKNDLVMYLAHDMKTPLTSVIGYLSLLNEAQDLPEDQQKKYTKISLEKAQRLEELINEFFDITRYNLQSIALEKEYFSLSVMLEQLADEFYPLLSSKGLHAELQLQPNLMVLADADKLARVFSNVLKNAVAYSEKNTTVFLYAWSDEQNVTVDIRNSGKQIPEHKLKSIFEKFYRLDSARSSKTGGTGLGLAIAREIVELHGGRIFATSSEQFTDFIVEFPVS